MTNHPAESRRFEGIANLLGTASVERLESAHVCVIGLGGVGSWTVEALARSGVGALTLIDPDEICISNINRQLPALDSSLGKPKAQVLQDRILDIHPRCKVSTIEQFILPSNADILLSRGFDAVVDAVDRMSIKALILATCAERNIPAVTVGGSGGKSDPCRIQVGDLGFSGGDELLRQVRRKLRKDHGWAAGEGNHYGVPTIFSSELPAKIPPESCDANSTTTTLPGVNCGNGLGSAVFVTGIFGLLAASEVVRILLADLAKPSAT